MPTIGSIMGVNEGLKQTLQRCNVLAGQVCVQNLGSSVII